MAHHGSVFAPGTARQVDSGQLFVALLPARFDQFLVRLITRLVMPPEEATCKLKLGLDIGAREQPVVTNFDKPLGQDMKEESSNELHW